MTTNSSSWDCDGTGHHASTLQPLLEGYSHAGDNPHRLATTMQGCHNSAPDLSGNGDAADGSKAVVLEVGERARDEVPPREEDRGTPPAAALRAQQARDALETLALFSQGDDQEEEDDDEVEGPAGPSKPWYSRRRAKLALLLNLLSFAVVGAGVALQLLPSRFPVLVPFHYLFRWLYFVGTVVPLYSALSLLMECVFEEIELHYFRDTLSYLSTLEKSTVLLLLALLEMGWFYADFELLFCGGRYAGHCGAEGYQQMVAAMEKALLCVLLFAAACWISSAATKAASTHFYRTAHFKKMQEALEKEYYLQALSAPKRKAIRMRRGGHGSHGELPGLGQRSQFHRRPNNADPPSAPVTAASSAQSSASSSLMSSRCPSFGPGQLPGMPPPGQSTPSAATAEEVKHPRAGHLTPGGSEMGSDGEAHELVPQADDHSQPKDLSEEMFRAFSMSMEHERATLEELKDEDRLEKLRTAVVVKTYSKLMEHYRSASAETAAVMMKNVKAFSGALFKNLSGSSSSRRSVILTDFELFFPNTEEGRVNAVKAFELFDVSNDGRVTKAEVKEVVMNIFRDRANIAGSLIDTDSIVQSLEQGFSGLIHFLFVGLYLLVWNINVVAGFATFSATLVGLSFIFGNSIRTIFESLVFLFSRHPYDVGDWVVINCEKYQIKKARLLFTMMVNIAGHPVYMSNSELNNKQIDNLSRSTSHTDYNAIEVDMGAAESVKREIKARLDEHIRANANDFEGRSTVFLQNLERADLKATLQVFFTMNYPGDHFERLIATRDAAYQVISDVIGRCRRDGHLQHTQARTVRLVGDAPSAPAQAAAPDRRVGS
eukprot:jgi/Tetstr1/443897/TSEL_031849.t1